MTETRNPRLSLAAERMLARGSERVLDSGFGFRVSDFNRLFHEPTLGALASRRRCASFGTNKHAGETPALPGETGPFMVQGHARKQNEPIHGFTLMEMLLALAVSAIVL